MFTISPKVVKCSASKLVTIILTRLLRDLYYRKKMIELTENKTGKKSFQILHEAVNEVLCQYNRII